MNNVSLSVDNCTIKLNDELIAVDHLDMDMSYLFFPEQGPIMANGQFRTIHSMNWLDKCGQPMAFSLKLQNEIISGQMTISRVQRTDIYDVGKPDKTAYDIWFGADNITMGVVGAGVMHPA